MKLMKEKNDQCNDDNGNKANWTGAETSDKLQSVHRHRRKRKNKPGEDRVNAFSKKSFD